MIVADFQISNPSKVALDKPEGACYDPRTDGDIDMIAACTKTYYVEYYYPAAG